MTEESKLRVQNPHLRHFTEAPAQNTPHKLAGTPVIGAAGLALAAGRTQLAGQLCSGASPGLAPSVFLPLWVEPED